MASSKLDLVRSIFAAWERGDYSSTEWAHPQIEFVFADGPEPGSWTGLRGLATANREWLSAWADVRIRAEDCIELDEERVLALTQGSGRGRTSGVEVVPMAGSAFLFQIRDGKVKRLVSYWQRARALADLGLALEAGDT
jgi:ketosteroid isomerase-like protein